MYFVPVLLILTLAKSVFSGSYEGYEVMKVKSLKSERYDGQALFEDLEKFIENEYRLCFAEKDSSENFHLFRCMMKSIHDNDIDKYISLENDFVETFNESPQNLRYRNYGGLFPFYVLRFGALNFLPILNISKISAVPKRTMKMNPIKCVKHLLKTQSLDVAVNILSYGFEFSATESMWCISIENSS